MKERKRERKKERKKERQKERKKGPTNRRTDTASYRDARTHLKSKTKKTKQKNKD